MRALFICNQNKNRSKTAELIFENKFHTKSAGLFNEKPVSEKELSWADIVFVMEDFQRTEISKRFPSEYLKKRIISLDIPDVFSFNEPELIEMLNERMKEFI
jgi:predicted protein tyrosine phosphatase